MTIIPVMVGVYHETINFGRHDFDVEFTGRVGVGDGGHRFVFIAVF